MNEHQTESLRACCDLEYLLIGDLRQLLKERSPPDNHTVRVLLARLLRNLPEVTRHSSISGYMTVALERCPRLYRQITTLQNANLDCLHALQELYDSIESESSFNDVSKETDHALEAWIESFGTMRSRESQLLQEAFTTDIGGEG